MKYFLIFMKYFLILIFVFCFFAVNVFAQQKFSVIEKQNEIDYLKLERSYAELENSADGKLRDLEIREKEIEIKEKQLDSDWNLVNSRWSFVSGFVAFIGIVIAVIGFFGFKSLKQAEKDLREIKEKAEGHFENIKEYDNKGKEAIKKINEYFEEKKRDIVKKDLKNLSLEDIEEIKKLAKKVERIDKKTNLDWNIIGMKYYEQGNYNKAIQAYKEAIEIIPDDPKAFNGWGASLSKMSTENKDITKKEMKSLLREAIDKFENMLKINSDDNVALGNIGASLCQLAEISDVKTEKESLLKEGMLNLQRSIKINLKNIDAVYNAGLALLSLSELRRGKNKHDLIKKAIDILETLAKNYFNYNNVFCDIGCFYSKSKDFDKSREYLDKYKDLVDKIDLEKLKSDEDFENLKNDDPEWWDNFINSKK